MYLIDCLLLATTKGPHMIPSKMAPGQKSLKTEYDERSVSLDRYLENHSNITSALSTDECFS